MSKQNNGEEKTNIYELEKRILLLEESMKMQEQIFNLIFERQDNVNLLLMSALSTIIDQIKFNADDDLYIESLFKAFCDAEKSYGGMRKTSFTHGPV